MKRAAATVVLLTGLLATPAAAEMCEAAATKAALDRDAETDAFQDCDRPALGQRFGEVAADLFDAARLLESAYAKTAPDFVAAPAEGGQSLWRRTIDAGHDVCDGLASRDWAADGAADAAVDDIEAALDAAGDLVGEVKSAKAEDLQDGEAVPFCKLMEHWSRARQLRKRFNDCAE